MTSIISFVLCLIIIGILYKNMIAWEGEYRISRAQVLVSGIHEETIFRAMLIPIGMRYLKGKNRALWSLMPGMPVFRIMCL